MRLTRYALPVAIAVVAAACPAPKGPETAVTPAVDSAALANQARLDSIARAEEERRMAELAAREAEQRRADSIARAERTSREMLTILEARIHFDFDQSTIRPGDAQLLDQKVDLLQANPDVRVLIAGNCDERGSDEYNLALGNRRAISAQAYLAAKGVDRNRLDIISYGEERPLDPRRTEEAWALNRNDQFSILTRSVVLRTP
jgi:peptidoglycan-associated lipoprotein